MPKRIPAPQLAELRAALNFHEQELHFQLNDVVTNAADAKEYRARIRNLEAVRRKVEYAFYADGFEQAIADNRKVLEASSTT